MATRRWRPLAFASVVTATLAGAVVLRAALSGGGSSPSAPLATPSPSPSTALAGAATPAAPPIESVAAEVLRKRTFAAGERVDVGRGIGFLAAENGALETWSAARLDETGFDSIQPTPDAALLIYFPPGDDGRPFIIERATGHTWRLGEGIGVLPEAGHGTSLVVTVREGDSVRAGVLNLLTGAVIPFGGEHHYLEGLSGVASSDGRRVAMHLGGTVGLLELATGHLTELARGVDQGEYSLQALPGALGFTISPHDPSMERRWFSWEGRELDAHLGEGAISPNGKVVARQWSPGGIRAVGVGGFPAISTVTLLARDGGRPLVQFLGASTPTRGAYSWSANSESLVVEVAEGYRLVSAAGQTISAIDDSSHILDPHPSPSISGLLGTNRGTIINTVRNQTIAPLYAQDPWHARWASRPGELIVELSSPGKGRSWPVDVMPFEARTNAIELPPRVVIDGGGCTELRELPSRASAIVECAPAGLPGLITAVEDPQPPSDPKASDGPRRVVAGVEADDLTIWLHVSLTDGASGWVPSTALDWG